MSQEEIVKRTIQGRQHRALEVEMVGEERWAEIRRLHVEEGRSISAIARIMDLDRKTVRRCVREACWQPYRRQAVVETLLAPHRSWLERRAPEVRYSARILYQELSRGPGARGLREGFPSR